MKISAALFARSLIIVLIQLSSASSMASEAPSKNVLVTGAGGKTGRLVMEKLLSRPAYSPVAVVRTESSKKSLAERGIPESKIVVGDICDASSMERVCEGMDAIIICTSATPAPTGEMTPEGRPKFGFPNGQPEQVDWIGQKNQIDGAAKNGVSHVVICSSMGGTNPENPLNNLGRGEDGKGGNILLWKRKAEKYLMDSGICYTIVHPGGLLDEDGGKREIVVGVDDKQVVTDNRSIPRADVAELLIASLEYDCYKNRSFDARTKPAEGEGSGTPTTDYEKLLLDMKENCDYSLGMIPE